MHIAYSEQHERLRAELRDYFATLMTPQRRAALQGDGEYGDGSAYQEIVRQMGRDGWLTLGWPVEHGGRGGAGPRQVVFSHEGPGGRGPRAVPASQNPP